jgi:hypothetical protein
MIYQDNITEENFLDLSKDRGVCISIYLQTSHIVQSSPVVRLNFRHMIDQAIEQAYDLGEKYQVSLIEKHLKELLNDDLFWIYQGKSLAVLVSNKRFITYRLAYEVTNSAKASDRFYLKPLLPALHPQGALVLAISQKQVTLYEFTPSEELVALTVPDMPSDLTDATGRVLQRNGVAEAKLRDDSGKKVLQLQFVRAIEKAIKPIAMLYNIPLILASIDEILSMYLSLNSYSLLSLEHIVGSVENLTIETLTDLTKPIVLKIRNESLRKWNQDYLECSNEDLSSSDLATIARLASQGQVRKLLVGVDSAIYGRIDEAGTYKLLDENNVHSYDLIDEIVDRVMNYGGEVLAVRNDETVEASLLPISASFRW